MPELRASAQIHEPVDRAHHQAAADKITYCRNDDVMERTAYGQIRIGRRTLSDRGPELRPGPRFDSKAVGQEIEVGDRVFEAGGDERRDGRDDDHDLIGYASRPE